MKELAQKFENLAHGETTNTDPLLALPVQMSRNYYHLLDTVFDIISL